MFSRINTDRLVNLVADRVFHSDENIIPHMLHSECAQNATFISEHHVSCLCGSMSKE